MKNRFTWLVIIAFFTQSISVTVLAFFDEGEMVELSKAAWGHSSEDFRRTTKNKLAIVPKKTRAVILEKQLFESGNWGFKVKVANGKLNGREFWVYYNVKKPSLKLYKQKGKKVPTAREEVKNPELANYAITKKEIPALPPVKTVDLTLDQAKAEKKNEILECGPAQLPPLATVDLSKIEAKLKANYDESNCPDVPVGKSRVINKNDNESPTGVQQKFKLSRLDENTYEVALNLKFNPNPKYLKALNITEAGLQEGLHKRIQDCIATINPKLIGPNGKKIQIRLSDSSEKSPPPEVKIAVDDTKRENSLLYSYAAECPTIAHELMHLMGLVDEYKEKSLGFIRGPDGTYHYFDGESADRVPKYDCRVLGPKDSLMVDPYATWSAAFGKLEVRNCDCGADAECQSKLTTWKENRCPPAKIPIRVETSHTENYNLGPSFFTKVNGSKISIYKLINDRVDGELNSILKPQQFMNIIAPDCESKNGDYYLCAKNAYSSTHVEKFIYNEKTNTYPKGPDGISLFNLKDQTCAVPKDKLPKSCSDGSTDWVEKIK